MSDIGIVGQGPPMNVLGGPYGSEGHSVKYCEPFLSLFHLVQGQTTASVSISLGVKSWEVILLQPLWQPVTVSDNYYYNL